MKINKQLIRLLKELKIERKNYYNLIKSYNKYFKIFKKGCKSLINGDDNEYSFFYHDAAVIRIIDVKKSIYRNFNIKINYINDLGNLEPVNYNIPIYNCYESIKDLYLYIFFFKYLYETNYFVKDLKLKKQLNICFNVINDILNRCSSEVEQFSHTE